MEDHLKSRPKKVPFKLSKQRELRKTAIHLVKNRLLPHQKIIKIILIGSSVKGNFGKYKSPGFRGSLYSDFDFIVFVDSYYKIPKWLKRELNGKPFADDKLNLAYRNKKLIDNKFDIEVFFVRKSSMKNPKIKKLGELAGIPMSKNSKHKHLVVYSRACLE
ncbi:MAG: hypothetical protein ABIG93_00815 [archaeon]|nr:hypothetical protein [Nanoarchaeota archaeon]